MKLAILPALLLLAMAGNCVAGPGVAGPECYIKEGTAWPGNSLKIIYTESMEECREQCLLLKRGSHPDHRPEHQYWNIKFFTWSGTENSYAVKNTCECKTEKGKRSTWLTVKGVTSGRAECCETEILGRKIEVRQNAGGKCGPIKT